MWVYTMGCSPSGMDMLQYGCSTGCISCQTAYYRIGLSIEAAVLAQSLCLHGLSTGCNFLQAIPAYSTVGSSMDICSTVIHYGLQGDGLQGDSLLYHGCLYGLQVISSSAWSTYSPSFFTDLGVSLNVFSLISLSCCCTAFLNLKHALT